MRPLPVDAGLPIRDVFCHDTPSPPAFAGRVEVSRLLSRFVVSRKSYIIDASSLLGSLGKSHRSELDVRRPTTAGPMSETSIGRFARGDLGRLGVNFPRYHLHANFALSFVDAALD
jgi:hypothetical protein